MFGKAARSPFSGAKEETTPSPPASPLCRINQITSSQLAVSYCRPIAAAGQSRNSGRLRLLLSYSISAAHGRAAIHYPRRPGLSRWASLEAGITQSGYHSPSPKASPICLRKRDFRASAMCFPPTPSFPLSAAKVNTDLAYPVLPPTPIRSRSSSAERRRAGGCGCRPGGRRFGTARGPRAGCDTGFASRMSV